VHVLHDLFNYVAAHLCSQGNDNPTKQCDHRPRYARRFCRAHGLIESEVIEWLESNGGYCDCEVLYNVASQFCDDDDDEPELAAM
jgi:hypothetical protein